MDNLENIDQLFRNELYDYSPKPPSDGWAKLEGELAKSKQLPLVPVWLRIAASILLIGGIATLGWRYFAKSENIETTQLAEGPVTDAAIDPVSDMKEAVAPEAHKGSSSGIEAMEEKISLPPSTKNHAQVLEEKLPDPKNIGLEKNIYAELSEEMETSLIEPDTPEVSEEQESTFELRSILLSSESLKEESVKMKLNTPQIDVNDLIIQQNLLANEESEIGKRKASWSVGGHAGPQYTYREVSVNTIPNTIDDYDEYETGVTTYAGGFQVEVEPANRFSIMSGVYYSKIGQIKTSIQANNTLASIDETWISGSNQYNEGPSRTGTGDLPNDLVNSTGNITFDKSLPPPVESSGEDTEWIPGIYTAEQYFEFIEVPIIIRYRLIDRKFNVNISSGVWANFLVGNKATATDNESFQTEGKTDDINTLNYSGSFSLGFGYPISSRLALSLEPFFKYYLSPINSNPQTDVYPYSLGVMSGVKYLF